ncbi:Fc.00g076590.m01.CDS01 [Cosmosporella sp. VM-42]
MSLKDRISSPLEAGTSVLDAHHLPPHLTPALEYASSRLAKKSIHVTLVVARRDYQLPTVVTPLSSPGLSSPKTPISPRFAFSNGPVTALKQLVRSGASYDGPTPLRVGIPSPRPAPPTLDTSSPRLRWPLSPTTPLSPPPMTPCTASSISTTDTMSSAMSSGMFGMRLIHASRLPEKREKTLRSTLERAEKKFRVGTEWLAPSVSPASCGLTNQLINTSIVQNEVLFQGEGLTLLSLDRLYSLKSALSYYSKTKSHLRLEDAVDELRRIILANNGEKVSKADLLRSYDWLNVSNSALIDLDRMYRRAYGGPEEFGGISGMAGFEPTIRPQSEFDYDEEDDDDDEPEIEIDEAMIGIAITTRQPSFQPTVQITFPPRTPSPKGPVLKLQTSFEPKSKKPDDTEAKESQDEEEDGERTARPSDHSPFMMQPWNTGTTIDQVLNADLLSPNLLSPDLWSPASRLGPMTPNGYDDISPTTRGEWGFLTSDDAFQGGRTVAVTTF